MEMEERIKLLDEWEVKLYQLEKYYFRSCWVFNYYSIIL